MPPLPPLSDNTKNHVKALVQQRHSDAKKAGRIGELTQEISFKEEELENNKSSYDYALVAHADAKAESLAQLKNIQTVYESYQEQAKSEKADAFFAEFDVLFNPNDGKYYIGGCQGYAKQHPTNSPEEALEKLESFIKEYGVYDAQVKKHYHVLDKKVEQGLKAVNAVIAVLEHYPSE